MPRATDPARDPARVWTTIATGQPPARHGIGKGRVPVEQELAAGLKLVRQRSLLPHDPGEIPEIFEVLAAEIGDYAPLRRYHSN